jgi:hypothetical protein
MLFYADGNGSYYSSGKKSGPSVNVNINISHLSNLIIPRIIMKKYETTIGYINGAIFGLNAYSLAYVGYSLTSVIIIT